MTLQMSADDVPTLLSIFQAQKCVQLQVHEHVVTGCPPPLGDLFLQAPQVVGGVHVTAGPVELRELLAEQPHLLGDPVSVPGVLHHHVVLHAAQPSPKHTH